MDLLNLVFIWINGNCIICPMIPLLNDFKKCFAWACCFHKLSVPVQFIISAELFQLDSFQNHFLDRFQLTLRWHNRIKCPYECETDWIDVISFGVRTHIRPRSPNIDRIVATNQEIISYIVEITFNMKRLNVFHLLFTICLQMEQISLKYCQHGNLIFKYQCCTVVRSRVSNYYTRYWQIEFI